jgi:hypothetical protein
VKFPIGGTARDSRLKTRLIRLNSGADSYSLDGRRIVEDKIFFLATNSVIDLTA